jgi:SAM-dependent methyltransferase
METTPLQGIESIEGLLSLPYFDMLACLGEFSLHPGGLNATVELLEAAGLRGHERVLEIGAGTGLTTRALMASGLDVTIVEPSSRMLAANLRNCARANGRRPRHFQATAETLEGVPSHTYQMVLYECVFGFIADHAAAVRQCTRILLPGAGRVCVSDLHYVDQPPAAVRTALAGIFGRDVAMLFEEDWRRLFADLTPVHWRALDLKEIAAPSPQAIKANLVRADLLRALPGDGDERFVSLAQRWREWNEVFAENKRYMRAHHAVWAT